MIPIERHEKILTLLKDRKFITTERLAKELFVSNATVRRDLSILEKQGQIKRVSGGASIIEPVISPMDLTLHYTNRIRLKEKEHIGKLATTLVKNGQKIFLDSSTTVMKLAEKLDRFEDLICLTNSVNTAQTILQFDKKKVHLIGGEVNPSYMNTYGTEAISNINLHYSDITFTSGRGLSEKGISDTNPYESEIKRSFSDSTRCLVALIDHSKFDVTHFNISVPLNQIDIIITDRPLPEKLQESITKLGIRVMY